MGNLIREHPTAAILIAGLYIFALANVWDLKNHLKKINWLESQLQLNAEVADGKTNTYFKIEGEKVYATIGGRNAYEVYTNLEAQARSSGTNLTTRMEN